LSQLVTFAPGRGRMGSDRLTSCRVPGRLVAGRRGKGWHRTEPLPLPIQLWLHCPNEKLLRVRSVWSPGFSDILRWTVSVGEHLWLPPRGHSRLAKGPPGALVRMHHEVESFQSSLVPIAGVVAGVVVHGAGQPDGDVVADRAVDPRPTPSHRYSSEKAIPPRVRIRWIVALRVDRQ
jgi:hypothetical protein